MSKQHHTTHYPQSHHESVAEVAPSQAQNNWAKSKLATFLAASIVAIGATSENNQAGAQTNISPDTTPISLAGEIDSVIDKTAASWKVRQLPNGRFVDPAQGDVAAYGAPMIGQAMIDSGIRNGDPGMIDAGILAQTAQINNPDKKGFNIGFEVFGLAQAYKSNKQNLAQYPLWQAAQPKIADFLISRSGLKVGESKGNNVEKCFVNSECWNNLKLVKAFASIALDNSGVRTAATASNTPSAQLSSESRSLLAQAERNSSKNAKRTGGNLSYDGASILSDPSRNPLAYHALSAMLLGRIAEELGPQKTPRTVSETLQKNARALTGLIAPDGDTSYIGRGQGQVWVPAATANALAVAAKHTNDPVWRGRYLKGVALSIQRVQTKHAPGNWGMPVVPKHLEGNINSMSGIDHYASTTTYNGLALDALRHTSAVLKTLPPTPLQNIGPDTNGSFVDPTHTEFATTKQGDLWWSIHGSNTHNDPRYDFGLVAAQKRQQDGTWKSVLPQRPLTKIRANGSLSMIQDKKTFVPSAANIKADGRGKVSVSGGWSGAPNKPAARGTDTKWSFQQRGSNEIEMKFRAPKTTTYRFQVWHESGSKITLNKRQLEVQEPDGSTQRYTLNTPIRTTRDPRKYSSAYDHQLSSTIISAKVKAGKTVKYTTSFDG